MSPSSDNNVPTSDDEHASSALSKPRTNESPEVTAKSAESNSSPTGGNNTRSFRFLLTLALRKAQTAVTLDNGGHIEEAIRTYREAISMLGLVLNRTNEEDGRQRLLHFRQTYSDRVSVLSSLRSSAGEPAETMGAKDSQNLHPESQEDSLAKHQHPSDTPDQGNDSALHTAKLPIDSIQIDGVTTPKASNADKGLVAHAAISINAAASTSPTSPTESGASLRSTPIISPVSLNKPLPSLSTTEEHERSSHRDSISSSQSMYSATQSNVELAKDVGLMEHNNDEDDVGETTTEDSKAEQAVTVRTKASDPVSANSGSAKPESTRPVKELKLKKKDRDSEKASRRQSVKNQRSLPAMFGIGLKSKSDKPVPPPVPHLPSAETTTSTLGRRIFGALRSNSSSNDLPTAKIPSIPVPSTPVAGTIATTAVNGNKSRAGTLPETSNSSESQKDSQNDIPKEGRTSSTASIPANRSVVYGSDEKIGTSFDSGDAPPHGDQKQAPSSIQPPTPAKDSPSAFPLRYQAQPALTKEQKRQSNAAHRLASMFRRKPSIPDIRSPVLPPKTSIEQNKSMYGMMQSPPQMHLMPKDRRLSASASTPNLIEAAAAAASNDQPSLAVYAAAERGDIPPMPAPPALRPSQSSTTPAAAHLKGRLSTEEGDYEGRDNESQRESSISGRQVRSDSDSSSIANVSITSRIDERRHKKQLSQTIRPSLRITTKSAMDVLSYVPEEGPVSNMPMSAGVDTSNRGRKLSVATSGSQSAIRGSTSLLSSAANPTMNGSQAIASTPLTATFPGIHMYSRPTLTDIEEDQRMEMFDPSFGTFHPDLGPAPPKASPLSALWFINTLHRSMVTSGAHLTPSLYVPRRLWYQSGIRITAIETKLGVLAQLTQSLCSLGTFLVLPDIDMLFSSTAPNIDARHSETVPWESEDPRSRNSNSKDELHKACVALHHWLNNFEDVLESSRRTLGRKLKYINSASSPGAEAAASVIPVPASTASHETLNASIVHMPATSGAPGLGDSNHFANSSLPSLALSNSDLTGQQGAPVSPLSPPADPADIRTLEKRVSDTPTPMTPGAQSVITVNRDVLNKDQMSNSRFKGFGKLGKSVDKIYSNIQKEKLDDTSAYATALQRLFEAAMTLEAVMTYFSRVASDADMAGWFTEVPSSPSSLANKRRTQNRAQGGSDSNIRGPLASPLTAQTTVATTEPSASSINTLPERKSSNTSISVNSTTEKKNRRRSNYFSQRQNGGGLADSVEGMRNSSSSSKSGIKPRGESFSTVPMIAPVMPVTAGGSIPGTAGGLGNSSGRFVLAQSPIKNPLLYVQQGKGRAPGIIYARLVRIAEWLNQVLLAWVVRDLQVLYAKYIKRLREWVVE